MIVMFWIMAAAYIGTLLYALFMDFPNEDLMITKLGVMLIAFRVIWKEFEWTSTRD